MGWVGQNSDGEAIPLAERFALGGNGTVRGYSTRKITPLNGSNGVVYGDKEAYTNLELIYPLSKKMGIYGSTFFDAGNTWQEGEMWFSDPKRGGIAGPSLGLYKSVGVGLLWYSPMDIGEGGAVGLITYMVATNFLADHCIIRASALTFTTILSIVPLLAVAFSISKGFGLQNAGFFRDFLMGVSAGRAEVVDKILQYIANTNVKTLGWIGVGTLLLTVFTTVGNVERAFNSIWRVKRGRTSWRKFTDFFSVIVICPIIVLVAASFTVAVQKLDLVHEFVTNPGYDWLEKLVFKLVSLALVWVGFTFVYAFVPNTRVRLKSAAVGGVIAGSMWQSAQWFYIHWQIGFTKYNAIYGSFAQLPLFLVWLYISWIIVLVGAELSYAMQHLGAFVRQGLSEQLSPLSRQKVAMYQKALERDRKSVV